MEQYISKSALVAEIERLFEKAGNSLGEYRNGAEHTLISINDFLDTIEVKEVDNIPNVRFPHYKSIVEKVFGAGNLESFEYDEAKQLVSLAKEELLKDLEVGEVDLKKLGEIARHLIAVKEHIEDMRLDEEEWFMLKKFGYPERFIAQKG